MTQNDPNERIAIIEMVEIKQETTQFWGVLHVETSLSNI